MRGRVQAEARQAGALGPDPHRDQLGHHPAGHEGGGRLAQHRGDLLEVLDQRPLAIVVVGDAVRLAPVGQRAEFLRRRQVLELRDDDRTPRPQRLAFVLW